MTAIGHLADVHLGTRKYGHRSLVVPRDYSWDRDAYSGLLAMDARLMLERSLEALHEKGVRVVVISGDLFDVARPENKELEGAARLFREWTERGMRFIVSPGDHDTPGSRDATPLDALAAALGGFVLIGRIPLRGRVEERHVHVSVDGADFYAVPFFRVSPERRQEMIARVNRYLDSLAQRAGGPRILLAHYGLSGYTHEADVAGHPEELPRVDYAAMGHVHKRHISLHAPVPLAYPGSLVPLSLEEVRHSYQRGPLLVEVERDAEPRVEEVSVEPVREYHHVRTTIDELPEEISRIARGARGDEPPLIHVSLRGVPLGMSERQVRRAVERLADEHRVIIRIAEIRRARPPGLVFARAAQALEEEDLSRLELRVLAEMLGGSERLATLVLQLKNALSRGDMETARRIASTLLSDDLREEWQKAMSHAPQKPVKPSARPRKSRRPARGRGMGLDSFF